MILTIPQIKHCMDSMVILVDTREQDNISLKRRLDKMPVPKKREKLLSGDYSAKCTLPDGSEFSLADKVAIERKMSIDEICGNFCSGRERFTNEFKRYTDLGGRLYVLVENAGWEKILTGGYDTKMAPEALTASLMAWSARYNCHIMFCDPFYSGTIIYKTLYYELKEKLTQMTKEAESDA